MSKPSQIVAVGASAGGLEALKLFFQGSLKGTSLAFVIVQHISPTHKSLMPELLSKIVDIPVETIVEGQEVEAGHIYLIPAGQNIRLRQYKFVCESTSHLRRVLNLPINIFLSSLAEEQNEQAVGVILSGTGSDGTLGLQRIHENGGLTIVQRPETAQFDGMPRAALESVKADRVLSPELMLDEIKRYCRGQKQILSKPQPLSQDDDEFNTENISQIFRVIRQRVNVDYSRYKVPTLVRRIQKRMKLCRMQTLQEYIDLLTIDASECEDLAKEFLINVTHFFRDPEYFDQLYHDAILPMVRAASASHNSLRIWVPACATGEEAYSIAMLFLEAEEELNKRIEFKIFATDLDHDSIQYASRGIYPQPMAAVIPEKLRNKYFRPADSSLAADSILRERILFAPQDLIHSPPFRRIDLISCRNVLIYFQHDLQQAIFKKFHYSLNDEGYLFLGPSESLSETKDNFEVVHTKAKIFRKIGASQGPQSVWTQEMHATLPHSTPSLRPSQTRALSTPTQSTSVFINQVLESLAGPGVIINEKMQIQHFIGDVSSYFAHPVGAATFDAFRLVRPEYSMALRTLVTKLGREEGGHTLFVELSDEKSDTHKLVLQGRRLDDKGDKKSLFFVGFLEPQLARASVHKIFINPESDSALKELEGELESTRETLQNTIEALEASNEELHSTNEELLSANEELQSTNEELQSVNEELHTVNSEHQMKIEELVELNSDLNNLLINTEIGVLFLDEKLNVRKYTQATKKYVHVMERDVGRSIKHLSMRLNFPTFTRSLEKALQTSETQETQVKVPDGHLILVRIVPDIRSGLPSPAGVTVIFFNISFQSDVMERMRGAHLNLLQSLIDHLPCPGFLKEQSGRYVHTNSALRSWVGDDFKTDGDVWWLDEESLSRFHSQELKATQSSNAVSDEFRIGKAEKSGTRKVTVQRTLISTGIAQPNGEPLVAGIMIPDIAESSQSLS